MIARQTLTGLQALKAPTVCSDANTGARSSVMAMRSTRYLIFAGALMAIYLEYMPLISVFSRCSNR
jgi:hypothetical protein